MDFILLFSYHESFS